MIHQRHPVENLDPLRERWRASWLLSLVCLVGLYALAVGVALIVLALRVRGLRRGRGLQGDLNPRGGNE